MTQPPYSGENPLRLHSGLSLAHPHQPRRCCARSLPHAQGFSRAQQCPGVPSTSMSLSPPCSLLSGKKRRQLPSQTLPFLPASHLQSGREQRRDSSCTTSHEGHADSSLLLTELFCLTQPGTERLQESLADVKRRLGFHSPPSCLPKPAASRPAVLVPNPTCQLLPAGKARTANMTLT